ncbi:hypothetical protein [Streptomyces griseoloalbus]|uniref:hypothetical protein n=1 Tax=Streptomyces griseoloalbus TaxID=67303 RepID=UPI00187412C6
MERAGIARPGARTPGPCLVAALLAGLLATGCDASGDREAGHASDGRTGSTAPSSAASSPSPRATSDEELCARLVGYWSREALAGTTYGDYQSMGLSNGQYDILRAAVDAARPVQRRQGTAAAHRLMDREVREGCVDRYRHGGPTEGPWQ